MTERASERGRIRQKRQTDRPADRHRGRERETGGGGGGGGGGERRFTVTVRIPK